LQSQASGVRQQQIIAVLKLLSRMRRKQKGRMVDALDLKGDEGRGVAAIRFGELLNKL
jgi:hypothetical protein